MYIGSIECSVIRCHSSCFLKCESAIEVDLIFVNSFRVEIVVLLHMRFSPSLTVVISVVNFNVQFMTIDFSL